MQIETSLHIQGGPSFNAAISCERHMLFAVVIPEGVDIRVERAIACSQTGDEVLLDTRLCKNATIDRKDDGDCEGEKEGVGRIGGVGERKDEGDEGEERGRNLDLSSMQFPCIDGTDWQCDSKTVVGLVMAYGETAVRAAFPRARMWLIAHPERRKTQKGMLRFLNRWLATPSTPGYMHNSNSLTRNVTSTAKIVKGRPTVQGW
jgi:hypothetical protein